MGDNERDLSDFFETASIGLHWVGPDGIILRANQAELDMLGYTREEYVGRHIAEFHVDQAVIEDVLARLTRGQTLHEQPARLRCKDGSIRHVLINSSVQFENGQFRHTRCFTIDITERKRAEENLRASEQRFRAMIDALPAAIYTTDANGKITHFNPACVEFSGRTPTLGSDHWCVTWKLFYPDGRPMPHDECPMAVALKEGRILHGAEAIAERPDGTRLWFMAYPTPLFDDQGAIIGGINMLVDITERKQAEQALRAGEERYRQTLSLMPVAVYACDAAGVITYYNQRAAELWGRTPRIGDTDERFCGSEQMILPDGTVLPHEKCPMAVALREGRSFRDQEVGIRRPDGSIVQVMVSIDPIRDEHGEITGAINAFHDVSAIRQAEQATARLAAIVTSSEDAIISKDLDGVITSWNRGAEHLFGYTAAEAVGKSVTILIPPDHLDEEPDILARIRRGEAIEHYETVRRRKDGNMLNISLTVSPIRDPSGRIIGASKVARDITGRKQAEDALRESEVRYRTLFDSIDEGFCIIEFLDGPHGPLSDYVHVKANRAYERHAGIHNVVGQKVRDIVPDEAEGWVELYRNVLVTGEPIRFERELVATGRHLELSAFRVEPSSRRQVAVLFQDVTARKQAEQALREADRRKTEFLATLGHELRNPLMPIRTGLEAMKRVTDDPARVEDMRAMMERQTRQMMRLIDDLLDVSRITRGKIDLRRSRVLLADVVQSAVEATRPIIDEAGHELTVNLPQEPVWMEADPQRLAQVFSNLLNNAAKYTPAGGRISLTARREGDQVVVDVTDTGRGVPGHMLEGIFEMFTQLDGSQEQTPGGLGIGLTLVRRLVEMHGGSVAVESEPDVGSTFSVRLPVAEVVAQPETMPAAGHNGEARHNGETEPNGGLRVMLVDDSKVVAESFATLLGLLGQQVQVVHSGAEALERIEEIRPDVVLSDVSMPGMSGYELARRLRSRESLRDVFLVAVTGYGQPEDRETALEAGFDDHLVKPPEVEDLQRVFGVVKGRAERVGRSG